MQGILCCKQAQLLLTTASLQVRQSHKVAMAFSAVDADTDAGLAEC